MALHQPSLQVGGVLVVGAAVGRSAVAAAARGAEGLAFTGSAAIHSLVGVGLGLVGAGSIMLRRGRDTTVSAGERLDIDLPPDSS